MQQADEDCKRVAALEQLKNDLDDPDISIPSQVRKIGSTSEFLRYLTGKDPKLDAVTKGSILFWLHFTTLEALEYIRKSICSGELTSAFYSEFVTPNFMRKLGLKSIKITLCISEEEYLQCKQKLLANGE